MALYKCVYYYIIIIIIIIIISQVGNRLQLNDDKTEVKWCKSTRKLSQRPSSPLPVAGALVQPVDAVRDLGVYTDCDLAVRLHMWTTRGYANSRIRQLADYQLADWTTRGCQRRL